jgi:hypothetical protein
MSDPSTEHSPESPAAHTERWQEAVTRRVRALLRTAPLHAPERLQRLRDADLGSVDVRSLALRVLDVTIEEMGLGSGARRVDVQRAIGEMLTAGGSPLTGDDAAGIAEVVVDALLNAPRRTAFSEPYMDWSGDTPTLRQLEWKLLQEQELSDGRFVLQATTEGINVYTGMLEYDVRDAQVAEEAVLHAQVRRGRIRDAVQTARNARLRSIELHEQLVRLLKIVERDVAQLRWEDDIGQHLEASRVHLGERMDAERKLRAMVSERRITASVADAPRLAELEDIAPYYSPEDERLVGELLSEVDERGLTVSAALERIRARGAEPRAEDLLVLKALHAFSPEGDTDGLETVRSGRALHDAGYFGDELTVYRGAP